MYRVLRDFADLQDNKHFYRTGDIFPRAGLDVSDERVAELASTRNKAGKVLIEAIDDGRKSAQKAKIQPVSDEKEKIEEDIAEKKKSPKKAKKKEK